MGWWWHGEQLGTLHHQCPVEKVRAKHLAGGKSLGKDPLEGQGCIPAPKSPLRWALLLAVPLWALPPSRARVHPAGSAGKGRDCAGSSPPAPPPGMSNCQASSSPAEQNFNGASCTGSSQRSPTSRSEPLGTEHKADCHGE